MSAKTNNLKIGTFVLVGTGLLLVGLFAFGARSYFEAKTRFETCVPDEVDGLSVGSVVKFKGVKVGKVTGLGFTWNEYPDSHQSYVIVRFEIRDRILPQRAGKSLDELLDEQIRLGLRARVKGQGITGISEVALEFVDSSLNRPLEIDWKPRNQYIPSAPSQFTRMLASIERSLRNFERLDIGQIGQRVETILGSLDRLVKNIDRLDFDRLGSDAGALIGELRDTDRRLQGLIDEARVSLKNVDVDGLSKGAEGLMTEVRATNVRLQTLLDNAGGPLQTILSELDGNAINEALANVRRATESLNEVLQSLKAYPSGFLWGKPPAPAQSVDKKGR